MVNSRKVATTSSNFPDLHSNIQNAQVSVDKRIDEIASNFNDNNNTDNSDDEWCEVEERPSGVTDTFLQQPDITEI